MRTHAGTHSCIHTNTLSHPVLGELFLALGTSLPSAGPWSSNQMESLRMGLILGWVRSGLRTLGRSLQDKAGKSA